MQRCKHISTAGDVRGVWENGKKSVMLPGSDHQLLSRPAPCCVDQDQSGADGQPVDPNDVFASAPRREWLHYPDIFTDDFPTDFYCRSERKTVVVRQDGVLIRGVITFV